MATINEKMTAIADAIRAKTGESSDVKYGLDAMAQAIAALEIGTALPGDLTAIDSGTVHAPTSQDAVDVNHALGKVPDFVLVMRYTYHNESTKNPCIIAQMMVRKKFISSSTSYSGVLVIRYISSGGSVQSSTTNLTSSMISSYMQSDTFRILFSSTNSAASGTHVLKWVCGAFGAGGLN